ncbi:MAG: NfeD family protein [Clostridia bacterium]|jgi:membrane-bound ClpP family serine protease
MELVEIIAGMGWLQAAMIIVGIALVIVEMIFPGFGAPGITGIILLLLGVILTAKSVFEALLLIFVIIVILALAFVIVLRSVKKGRLSKTLVLSDAFKKESGYTGTEDLDGYLGKEGITVTVLRPAGTAVFDGEKLDVVSEGEYISEGSKVRVVQVAGRRIVVRKV